MCEPATGIVAGRRRRAAAAVPAGSLPTTGASESSSRASCRPAGVRPDAGRRRLTTPTPPDRFRCAAARRIDPRHRPAPKQVVEPWDDSTPAQRPWRTSSAQAREGSSPASFADREALRKDAREQVQRFPGYVLLDLATYLAEHIPTCGPRSPAERRRRRPLKHRSGTLDDLIYSATALPDDAVSDAGDQCSRKRCWSV